VLHRTYRGSSIDAERRMRAGVNPQPEEACIQSTVTAPVWFGLGKPLSHITTKAMPHAQSNTCVCINDGQNNESSNDRQTQNKYRFECQAPLPQHAGANPWHGVQGLLEGLIKQQPTPLRYILQSPVTPVYE
jgi:hypothetical protein